MRLTFNIDHIATLRNARGESNPDPVFIASLAELAGVSGIVCHLREDRRHIQDDDLFNLRKKVKTKLDMEMAATDEMRNIAIDVRPDLVTLVPEKREELTTEGGLNLESDFTRLKNIIHDLKTHNIPVSLFINPEEKNVLTASNLGADFVELHTGDFSQQPAHSILQKEEFTKLKLSARLARERRLRVNAGHGLNYYNITIIKEIKEIEEVSIGHAIISRALYEGIPKAIKEMKSLLM